MDATSLRHVRVAASCTALSEHTRAASTGGAGSTAGLIPAEQIRISSETPHGFLLRYPAEVAAEVDGILAGERPMNDLSSVEDLLADEVSALARACTEAQTFVALLAHEVRTRLKVTERALASADEAGLRIASENTWTLQELVEDLLELARARPDARADAGDAMRWVVEDLGDGVAADFVVGELPTIALPPALLRTVLRNLVVNALEAGASRVEVFPGRDGSICVRDDGPGVAPAMAAKIFGSYSGKFGGAGLALALCREILRQRGGELWLEPPSTFGFRVQ